jgi:hypothetical protein
MSFALEDSIACVDAVIEDWNRIDVLAVPFGLDVRGEGVMYGRYVVPLIKVNISTKFKNLVPIECTHSMIRFSEHHHTVRALLRPHIDENKEWTGQCDLILSTE